MKHLISLVLLVIMVIAVPLTSAQDDATELQAAVDWLISQQLEDGSWSDGFTEDRSGSTADAIFALATAGVDVTTVESSEGNTPLEFLETHYAESETVSAARTTKVVTALSFIGENPREFVDIDLVNLLLETQDETGLFVDNEAGVFGHCLIMNALIAYVSDMPDEEIATALETATETLVGFQDESGGWGFAVDSDPDTNTTAVCVQALAWLETAETAVESALAYFAAIQNEDGSWPYQSPSDFGIDGDANSTSLVALALIFAEQESDRWNAEAIFSFLLGLQNESGAFAFNNAFRDDNFLATVAVIPVLASQVITEVTTEGS